MKASIRQQQLLLTLQDLDNTLARLRRKKAQLPQRAALQALEGSAQAAKQAFMAVQRELDTQKGDIDRLESDIEMVQQRIARDEQLLSVSTASKEAQALQHELDTLLRRKTELEDRELELMEINEVTQQRFDEATQALNHVDQQRQTLKDEIAAAEHELDTERTATAEERAGLSAELQRDLLDHYEAIRARTGIGAARLRGKISEASNMELAPGELSGILEAAPDEIVHCPQSGAILVRVYDE